MDTRYLRARGLVQGIPQPQEAVGKTRSKSRTTSISGTAVLEGRFDYALLWPNISNAI